jgi:hypothetical protein
MNGDSFYLQKVPLGLRNAGANRFLGDFDSGTDIQLNLNI